MKQKKNKGLFHAFPTLLGGHQCRTIDLWALRFLVVREINCGTWLARGYMPAGFLAKGIVLKHSILRLEG